MLYPLTPPLWVSWKELEGLIKLKKLNHLFNLDKMLELRKTVTEACSQEEADLFYILLTNFYNFVAELIYVSKSTRTQPCLGPTDWIITSTI